MVDTPLVAARRLAGRAGARTLLFVSGVLFGLSAVLVKLATRGPGGLTGPQATAVRFALGLVLVVALFRLRPGSFRPSRPWLLAARGLFGGLAAVLYFVAIARIPAGEATLLNNTFPIWAVMVSFLVLRERPTAHLLLALAVTSTGVFLVLGGGHASLRLGPGQVLAILSAVFGGVAVTAIRALRATVNAFTVFFAFAVGSLAVSVPFAGGPWPTTPGPWLYGAGVGVVAFGAQLSMTQAYGELSVPEAALWQQLTPIASYAWSLAIGERITPWTALGVLLGAAGVAYGAVFGHRPSPAAASDERAAARGIPLEEP
ncbi:MAG TPA: DMT family transporter [Anaeromyxobacteraceae bacterium]|nr:DMT family transporter [Anaeromyxobacteraceae bacterium]